MKVMFAGDTHGRVDTVKHIIEEANDHDCDAVFQLGDFGYWEHAPEGVKFLDDVGKMAYDQVLPWYFLDGNHDKTSLLLQNYDERDDEGFIKVREYVYYAPRGHRWTWDGLRFASFGGAYSVDKAWRIQQEYKIAGQIFQKNKYRPDSKKQPINSSGTLWFPEEEMTDIDMDEFLKDTTPVDIMLAHDKPRAANPDWNRKDSPECWPNQDRLQKAVRTLQPKLFLHGHLHYQYVDQIRCGDDDMFTTVRGLNADGGPGTCMVLDLDKYREDISGN